MGKDSLEILKGSREDLKKDSTRLHTSHMGSVYTLRSRIASVTVSIALRYS